MKVNVTLRENNDNNNNDNNNNNNNNNNNKHDLFLLKGAVSGLRQFLATEILLKW